jgi:hypothetical protein
MYFHLVVQRQTLEALVLIDKRKGFRIEVESVLERVQSGMRGHV